MSRYIEGQASLISIMYMTWAYWKKWTENLRKNSGTQEPQDDSLNDYSKEDLITGRSSKGAYH